ncbi:MAG: hypothetical protein SGPRY_002761 [Prymnesium sp.]
MKGRDEISRQLKEAHEACSELETRLASAKNDASRALAAKSAAEERGVAAISELQAKQREVDRAQQLLQEQEHRLGMYSKLRAMEEEESLPSPVSIPSVPLSPIAKGGRFALAATAEEENAQLKSKVARMEEQAEKTRQVVHSMRQELERLRAHDRQHNELLQQRCDELSRGMDGGFAAAEVRMLRGRARELEDAAAQLRAEKHATQVELERARGEAAGAASLEQSVRSKEVMISQLQARVTEVTAQLEAKSKECETLRAEREGGGLVRELQATEGDLARLVAEREKLMEISNMLRADLNRVVSEGPPPSSANAVERVEREVAGRYESKLRQIESSMRQLVSQNTSLKEELTRWTSNDSDDWMPSLHTSKGVGGGRRRTSFPTGGPSSPSSGAQRYYSRGGGGEGAGSEEELEERMRPRPASAEERRGTDDMYEERPRRGGESARGARGAHSFEESGARARSRAKLETFACLAFMHIAGGKEQPPALRHFGASAERGDTNECPRV